MLNYLKTIDIDNIDKQIIFNNKEYKFNKIEPNIYCFSYEYYDYYFIKIKNKLIELDNVDLFITLQSNYYDEEEISSHEDYINEFKSIIQNDECLIYSTQTDFLNDKPISQFIDYYCIFDIDEDHYLGIHICYMNSLNSCEFNKNVYCYLLNKDLSKKYALTFNTKNLKILNEIYNKDNNSHMHIQLLDLSLKELIDDKSKLQLFDVFDEETYKSTIMKNINTLINPILEDNNVIAYFKEFPEGLDKKLTFVYEETLDDNFVKKAEAISKFLIGDSCINVFTGDILENQFKQHYKDNQYLIIKIPSTNFNYIYENIDNIYCLMNARDNIDLRKIDEAYNRAKLVELLS